MRKHFIRLIIAERTVKVILCWKHYVTRCGRRGWAGGGLGGLATRTRLYAAAAYSRLLHSYLISPRNSDAERRQRLRSAWSDEEMARHRIRMLRDGMKFTTFPSFSLARISKSAHSFVLPEQHSIFICNLRQMCWQNVFNHYSRRRRRRRRDSPVGWASECMHLAACVRGRLGARCCRNELVVTWHESRIEKW